MEVYAHGQAFAFSVIDAPKGGVPRLEAYLLGLTRMTSCILVFSPHEVVEWSSCQ
jgi:hypothetical protein